MYFWMGENDKKCWNVSDVFFSGRFRILSNLIVLIHC